MVKIWYSRKTDSIWQECSGLKKLLKMVIQCRPPKNGTKWLEYGAPVKRAQYGKNGKDVAHSYKWMKMVKMWRTRKDGLNVKNVAHSRKNF